MSLLEKLSKIQAVIDKASLDGERQAATLAMDRLLKRQEQSPKQYRSMLPSIWQKKLFVVLCHKYGIKTYRYPRQRHTTVVTWVTSIVMDETLWPEYEKYSSMLQDLLDDVLESVIAKIGNEQEEVVVSDEIESAQEFKS